MAFVGIETDRGSAELGPDRTWAARITQALKNPNILRSPGWFQHIVSRGRCDEGL